MDGRFYAELLFLAAALGAVLTFAVWGRDKRVLPRLGEIFAVGGLGLLVVQATRSGVVTGWIRDGIAQSGVSIAVVTVWRAMEIAGLVLVGGGVLLLSMIAAQERRRRNSERAVSDVAPGLTPELLRSVLDTTPSATMVLRPMSGLRRGFSVALADDNAQAILQPSSRSISEPPLSLHRPAGFAEAVADAARKATANRASEQGEWTADEGDRHYSIRATARGESVLILIDDVSNQKRSETALTEIAFTDPVTGLANRAGAQRAIDAEAEGVHAGERRAFALFYLDFDGFKSVNDTHGHEAGDELLVSIAGRVRSFLHEFGYKRGNDFVAARWGGDEFVVMLREPNRLHAWQAAEKLCAALAEPHTVVGDVSVTSTASIGMAWCDGLHEDGASAVSAADSAMYQAKNSGKNRVVIASRPKERKARGEQPGPGTADAA